LCVARNKEGRQLPRSFGNKRIDAMQLNLKRIEEAKQKFKDTEFHEGDHVQATTTAVYSKVRA